MKHRPWLCWFGWHAYCPWRVIHRQQLTLTDYDTGTAQAWAETLDERRTCARCGKIQWRYRTRRM